MNMEIICCKLLNTLRPKSRKIIINIVQLKRMSLIKHEARMGDLKNAKYFGLNN